MLSANRSRVGFLLLASTCLASLSMPASAQDTIDLETVTVETDGSNNAGTANGQASATATNNAPGVSGGTEPFAGYAPRNDRSATKGDAPLIKTPQAVSVVGARQIEDQAARTVTEATRYSPGIRSETFGFDPRNDWFLIRGFSSQVSSYFLDGLQLQSSDSFATWKVNPYLLERIDILRGPSSALYGSSNPGGLINLVSKRPNFRNGGEVTVGVNEFGNVWSGLDAQGVNPTGTMAYRMVATGNIGDTKVDFIHDDQFAVMPTFTWAPDADTSLTVYAQASKLKTRSQNFLPYEGTVTRAPFGRISRELFTSDPDNDDFERTQLWAGYELEHSFNDTVTIRQNLRYAKLEVDYTGFYGLGYAAGNPTETTGVISRGALDTHPDLGLFNIDNQVELKGDIGPIRNTFLVGLDYKNFNLFDTQAYGAADNFDVLNPVYNGGFTTVPAITDLVPSVSSTELNQTGVYVQDRIEVDRLSVLLSGRYDNASTDVQNYTFDTDTDTDVSAFSGRAGVIYNFDTGISPYASVSRSFLPLIGTDDVTLQPFDPETSLQYEAGVKFQPESWGSSLISASVFDLTRQNFVTSDGAFFNRQVGEIKSQGFELEGVGQITDDLKAIASYTWYDLEIEEGNPAEIGNLPTGVPEQFGSLWLDYTVPAGTMLEGVSFGGGTRYVGRSFADSANTLKVPDVWLFDAAIRYEKNNFRAALNASNIFDEKYVASCNGTCYYGESREVNLTLTYKW